MANRTGNIKPQATTDQPHTVQRNIPILTGQGALSIMAWTLASPSIVMTFLAVSLDLPVLLAGALISIRHGAGTCADVLASDAISRIANKRKAILLADVGSAACFILVVAVALQGNTNAAIVAFVVAIFFIGLIEETKSMLVTDFISDNFDSEHRMVVHYTQLAIGGAGAIALALGVHELMKDAPALSRHSTVVTIGALCFVLSGLSFLAFGSTVNVADQGQRQDKSWLSALKATLTNGRALAKAPWFQKYLAVRLSLISVGLALPFYALIAAEAHHGSARGLTALIVSSAAAMLVAAPLWRVLNSYSNRIVIVAGTSLAVLTGSVLIVVHFAGFEHRIDLHATTLFLVTIAATGVTSARGLYFMDIAPKEQRVDAQAFAKLTARVSIVLVSALLALIAHTNEVIWAVVGITVASVLAIVICLMFVPAQSSQGGPKQEARSDPAD